MSLSGQSHQQCSGGTATTNLSMTGLITYGASTRIDKRRDLEVREKRLVSTLVKTTLKIMVHTLTMASIFAWIVSHTESYQGTV